MSDSNDSKTTGRKPLTVSRKSSGTVKQSFSHGRSKQVVVETKKRRTIVPGAGGTGGRAGKPPVAAGGKGGKGGKEPSKIALLAKKLGITEAEVLQRQKALLQRKAQEESRSAKKQAATDAQERLRGEQERKQTEEKLRQESESRRRAEEEAAAAAAAAEAAAATQAPKAKSSKSSAKPGADPASMPDPNSQHSGGGRSKRGRSRDDRDRGGNASSRPRADKRRKGKLTIANALGDDGDRQRSLASLKRARERERERRSGNAEQREKVSVEVTLPETITLQTLAQRMNERVADVVKFMMQQGEMLRGNDIIDADTAELIAEEFGHTVKRVSEADVEIGLEGDEDDPKDMLPRPPIVTIMGHVDHGKTSLLDALRATDVASGEAGGITQHIGAYQVTLKSGAQISFLDTPGHAAFTAMRARGASATDIAILVVAADDSVMPQTHADTAELIAEEFGHTVKRVSEADVEIGLEGDEDDPKDMLPRPPIVTIMGHVDHGKTSLLDALRATDVASGEAGGITQHIGAYQVTLKSGAQISFLDTPGHAAFTAMRARGASATDIAILVVAADDSVMPQTIESINHAKAAGVPIIVAVNKCDLEGANPDKVLTDLLQHDVQVESMGGDVQAVKVSAIAKTGLDELTEAITLQAELLELKANPNRAADGVVVESQLDKGRGPVATVLVKRGTLKRGDIVVAGAQWGKVRALNNERAQQVPEAGPSVPIEILGLDGAPDPGEAFVVVDSEARAREVTEFRVRQKRQVAGKASAATRASLDQLLARLKDGTT